MGFWKNIGLFNMLTAKTPGDFLVGSLIVEDEIQKEKQKQETQNSIKLEKTVIKGTNPEKTTVDKNKVSCENRAHMPADKKHEEHEKHEEQHIENEQMPNLILNEKEIIDYSTFKSDGQYLVDEDIDIGEYLFYSPDGNGYYALTLDANGKKIVSNKANVMSCFINLEKLHYIYIEGGYLISTASFSKLKYKKMLGSTIYRIGIDMPEGIYKIKNNDEEMTSYYCIYNQAFDSQTQIISNGNFKGIKYIEVQNGNYLELDEKVDILDHKPPETKVNNEKE